MSKLLVKTGDHVAVTSGQDKGKQGKVLQTFPKLGRVVVEGVNVNKRHLRSQKRGEKGQIVEFPMPIPVSRVQFVGSDGKTLRLNKRPQAS
ncbi:MAG: 50S ribosomal protein L24 [Candidatus Uhrbacteria bacterium]|nr:50S ribosomal protein L24 [Candidatus Uhrbacteria bacterium]MDP3794075.1 50S ribosomal protein L24 [Candidatus Uhrbacteria bacterium]